MQWFIAGADWSTGMAMRYEGLAVKDGGCVTALKRSSAADIQPCLRPVPSLNNTCAAPVARRVLVLAKICLWAMGE